MTLKHLNRALAAIVLLALAALVGFLVYLGWKIILGVIVGLLLLYLGDKFWTWFINTVDDWVEEWRRS